MTRNGPPITTAQAQVTTATVEIRTLTVSGKRMSIAVYEQMPARRHLWIEPYAGGEAGYRVQRAPGEVWGWVNRHGPECNARAHLHVVSAHQGLLFRGVVTHDPSGDEGWPFWDGVVYDPGTHNPGRYDFNNTWTPQPAVERLQREWVEAYDDIGALPQLYIAT